jgi:parallel beta-helix repeat protein
MKSQDNPYPKISMRNSVIPTPKKAQGMPLTMIIIAALVLVVLVVIVMINTGYLSGWNKDLSTVRAQAATNANNDFYGNTPSSSSGAASTTSGSTTSIECEPCHMISGSECIINDASGGCSIGYSCSGGSCILQHITISNGQPTGLLAGATQARLYLETDKPATCRYSPNQGIDFDTIADTFANTGGTAHSQVITGLVSGSYNYYVRCRDSSGNTNDADYLISFSVALSNELKIVGYLSDWSMANVPNALSSVNLGLVTHLCYQSIKVTSSTDPALFSSWGLTDTTNRFKQVIAAGHARGIPVLINFYNSNSDLSSIVNSPTLLSQLATNLANYVASTGADGVDIDWEYGEPATEMTRLITALHAALPSNKLIFVAASWYRNDVELSAQQYVDLINVMSYDMERPISGCAHSTDPTGYPYHSTYDDSVCVMNMWANAGYDKSKLTMGIPFYGKDSDGTLGLYGQIVDDLNPSSSQNEASISTFRGQTVTGGKLWWNGPDYVKKKATWAKANGFGGVMAFDIAEDKLNDPPRSLLQAIYDSFYGVNTCSDGTVVGSCSGTKPYYCATGGAATIARCAAPGNCGCPTGQTCQTTGTCVATTTQGIPPLPTSCTTLTPSGGTSDQTAINSRISSISAAGGGCLKLSGNFVISGEILMGSEVTLILEGKVTLANNARSTMLYASGKSNIRISGGEWDGNGANQGDGTSNNPGGQGFLFDQCDQVIIDQINMHDIYTLISSYSWGERGEGLYFTTCSNVQLLNNKIYRVNMPIDTYVNGGSQGNGIYFYGQPRLTSGPRYVGHGIFFAEGGTNIVIRGNTVQDSLGGIYLYTQDSGLYDTITIEGNTLQRIERQNMILYPAGSASPSSTWYKNIKIINNKITDCGLDYDHNCIDLGNNLWQYPDNYENIYIGCNSVTRAASDIMAVGYANGITIKGNRFEYAGLNTLWLKSSNTIVDNNKFRNWGTYWIRIYSGTGNKITNSDTGGNENDYSDAGSSNMFSDNNVPFVDSACYSSAVPPTT